MGSENYTPSWTRSSMNTLGCEQCSLLTEHGAKLKLSIGGHVVEE